MKSHVFVLAFLVLMAGAAGHTDGQAPHCGPTLPTPQHVEPIYSQTVLDPSEPYQAPSATEPLTIGNRLDLKSDLEAWNADFVVIQRLTERTYYVQINVFAVTVVVGNRGVLLIDCGGHNAGQPSFLPPSFDPPQEVQSLLGAVAQITPLPITHLVYSHPHTDHVGNSVILKQMFPNLEIIASRWAAQNIRMFEYPIARPTHIVRDRYGSFRFEGKRFRMVTPVPVAHTPADSYIVTPDRVMHVVDIINPMRLPFVATSVAQNLDGYLRMLRHLVGEAEANTFDFINPGHLNVGYARDLTRVLNYHRELYQAWWQSLQEAPLGAFIQEDNAAVWLRNFFDHMAGSMSCKVAEEYGEVRFFELVRDHALKVHENQFLHRLNAGDPTNFLNRPIPNFDPIPPRLYRRNAAAAGSP